LLINRVSQEFAGKDECQLKQQNRLFGRWIFIVCADDLNMQLMGFS